VRSICIDLFLGPHKQHEPSSDTSHIVWPHLKALYQCIFYRWLIGNLCFSVTSLHDKTEVHGGSSFTLVSDSLMIVGLAAAWSA